MERLQARSPETLSIEALTLEEIFVSTLQPGEALRHDRDRVGVRAGRVEGGSGALPCLAACVLTIVAGAVIDDWYLRRLALLAYGLGRSASACSRSATSTHIGRWACSSPSRSIGDGCCSSSCSVALRCSCRLRGRLDRSSAKQTCSARPFWRESALRHVGRRLWTLRRAVADDGVPGPLPAVVFSVAHRRPSSSPVNCWHDRHGCHRRREIDTVKLTVFWWGIVALCAVAAVTGWRMFMRLESIEGRGTEVALPDEGPAGHAAARHGHARDAPASSRLAAREEGIATPADDVRRRLHPCRALGQLLRDGQARARRSSYCARAVPGLVLSD